MTMRLLVVVLLAIAAASVHAKGPPNVVLLLADDLGWAETGAYGQTKIHTPNIDAVAREGMRFTQAYSGAPVCASARCVLLTGKHTGHAAIRGNAEVGGWGPEEPEGQRPLPTEEVTLAEHLKALGYTTLAVGKWGLGGPCSVGHPNAQGFDRFYGYLCQRVAHNYYPTHLWRNADVDIQHGNVWFSAHQRIDEPPATLDGYDAFRGDDYAPDAMDEEAVRYLTTVEPPFFLSYATPLPHLALQVPDDLLDEYPEEWDPEPYLGQQGYLPHPRPRAAYAAMITRFDRTVGTMLAAIESRGLTDDTIVIITSDNGASYVGGVDRAFFDSHGPLRGHKGQLYEGGIRVPFIARWPGHVAASATSDVVTSAEDVVPTILDLVGAPAATDVDGVSLAPALLGAGRQSRPPYRYWEHPEGGGWQAVRLGDYKGVRRNVKQELAPIELYDLSTDVGETTNVAADHPDVVAEIERIMVEGRTVSEAFPMRPLDARTR